MFHKRLVVALAVAAALAVPVIVEASHQHGGPIGGHGGGGVHFRAPAGGFARGGHFAHPSGGWVEHPAWSGGGQFHKWQGGHWWRGNYGGRYGAWWIVGPDWYWYPTETAVIPDPYTPPGMTPGYWYWCQDYNAYYPYVGACPSGWVPEAMP